MNTETGRYALQPQRVPLPAPNRNAPELAERLADAIGTDRGRLKEAAAKASVPMTSLRRYLAGQDINSGDLVALARACGVRVEWLATGEPPMRPEASTASAVSQHPTHHSIHNTVASADDATIVGYIGLPNYEALASAGHSVLAGNSQLVGSVLFKVDWIRDRLRRDPDRLVLVEARGDSMDPQVREGDLLLVDISPELRDGTGLYVLRVGDNLLVRRLDRRIDGSVVLTTDNPRYQPETVPPTLVEQLRILGQVVWQGGPVRW